MPELGWRVGTWRRPSCLSWAPRGQGPALGRAARWAPGRGQHAQAGLKGGFFEDSMPELGS